MEVKEVLKDSLPIIEKAAPTLFGALFGPAGVAVGYALPIIANAFGVNSTDLPGLSSAISNDENASIKLTELEARHGALISTLLKSSANLSSLKIEMTWQHD